jgi:hypothetical protein
MSVTAPVPGRAGGTELGLSVRGAEWCFTVVRSGIVRFIMRNGPGMSKAKTEGMGGFLRVVSNCTRAL